jgi:hypothetical protein
VIDDYTGTILSKNITGFGSKFFTNVFLSGNDINATLITDLAPNQTVLLASSLGIPTKLDVVDQLILETPGGGTVSTGGFLQNFSLVSQAVQVPEPGGLLLIATGFLPVILFHRRRGFFRMM